MNKWITAIALIAGMTIFMTACSGRTRATVVQTQETYEATPTTSDTAETIDVDDDSMGSVTLNGSEEDSYTFVYDTDIVTYSGQGGNFFLVGSNPTECYLHIMIQSGDTYEDALKSASGRIVEEYTLDSGRRAVCFRTNDETSLHVIIEANDIISSGTGVIKITIGSADSWYYTQKQIANMVDKGF